jgi:hypothetical protein
MNMMHKPERCHHDRDAGSCPECASGSRNRYYRRKMMTAEDFRAEQDYMIGRRRLLNRAIHGWGVVDGLVVTGIAAETRSAPDDPNRKASVSDRPPYEKLAIGSGLALDRHGRELIVPGDDYELCQHNLFVVNEENPCKPQPLSALTQGTWLLSAHYAEQRIDRVRMSDACDCAEYDWNRVCETVVYSLSRVEEECASAEPDCPENCGCPDQPASAPGGQGQNDVIGQDPQDHPPGGVAGQYPAAERDPSWPRSHRVLCCWSDHARTAGAGSICHWRDDIWIDPCDGVPLACVEVWEVGQFESDGVKCIKPIFGEIFGCAPRRIVKRNDLLFDLIRGCDLTRIDGLSWLQWGEPDPGDDTRLIDWNIFSQAIIQDVARYEHPWLKDTVWYQKYNPDTVRERPTKFEIEFDGPVKVTTVTPQAIAITGFFPDHDTGWNKALRVPITRILHRPPGKGDPDDTTRCAMVVVHYDWVYDEIVGNKSEFRVEDDRTYYPFIEIEIFGDLIEDCRGVPIDANTAGRAVIPSGNGTPGGTCRTVFRVTPKPAETRQTRTA